VLVLGKRQRVTAADYMATAAQITKARESLARFFFKGGVAFNLIEQEVWWRPLLLLALPCPTARPRWQATGVRPRARQLK
jgi:hypothetical protein